MMEEKMGRAAPSAQVVENGMEIMHLKNNGENCAKMTVEEFMPFMAAPLGYSEKGYTTKRMTV